MTPRKVFGILNANNFGGNQARRLRCGATLTLLIDWFQPMFLTAMLTWPTDWAGSVKSH